MRLVLAILTMLAPAVDEPVRVVRVNQVGYLPDAPKVAVLCALARAPDDSAVRYHVEDARGRVVLRARRAPNAGAFGPCAATYRLDFTSVRAIGRYTIVAGEAADVVRSPAVSVGPTVYAGGADTLLYYMRQQRSGFNPFFRDSVHRRRRERRRRQRARRALSPRERRVGRRGGLSPVRHDLGDRDVPPARRVARPPARVRRRRERRVDARGLPGPNGTPDVLDEARHGLDWLLRMYPGGDTMFNQLGDDRDHSYLDLPTTDSSDYGWGKGRERAVYPCTGRPQGLFQHRRTARPARVHGRQVRVGVRARRAHLRAPRPRLRRHAPPHARSPPTRSAPPTPASARPRPAARPTSTRRTTGPTTWSSRRPSSHALTGERRYLRDALRLRAHASRSRHGWAPTRRATTSGTRGTTRGTSRSPGARDRTSARLRRRVLPPRPRARRAPRRRNGFRIGVPFIWCSNDLMASFATQALLYRAHDGRRALPRLRAGGDRLAVRREPVGNVDGDRLPERRHVPARPALGGARCSSGPARSSAGSSTGRSTARSIGNLRGIALHDPDEYALFNTGFIVYHDDVGDYSTNEPIMDGTANLLVPAVGARGSA